jgi:small subunit ribosomal protein S16
MGPGPQIQNPENTTPVAVKIKLKRLGKIRQPQYRIIIADARNKRDGRAIEEIGKYHPKEDPSFIEVNSERVQYWLSVGAQPTDPVRRILALTGDWQKYKGLKAPAPLKVAAPKPDKHEIFAVAVKEVVGDDSAAATTPKGRGGGKGKKAQAEATEAAPAADDAAGEKPESGA